jgi:hypothetical protein
MEAGCFTCQETFLYNQDLKTCYCPDEKEIKEDGKCEDKSGLSALAIIAIIVGILAAAGAGNCMLIQPWLSSSASRRDNLHWKTESTKPWRQKRTNDFHRAKLLCF